MTTAARTRRPRVFRVERRSCILPAPMADLVIGSRQHNQADVLVAAPTKAAALARLQELGFYNNASHLSVATGKDVDVLQAAEMLDHDGDVLASRDSRDGLPVLRVRGGDTAPVLVGAWHYDRTAYRMTFAPQEGA